MSRSTAEHPPIVALTAGDVAGIGPEVLFRTLQDPAVRAACVPLVVCHPAILRRAAELCGVGDLQIRQVDAATVKHEALLETASNSVGASRTVLCCNPAGDSALQASANVVSAAAGEAAYAYLITAIRLAKAGVVDAIATAPLNKAALHAAGHTYPGHTEILADQCDVDAFAMMLHLPESRLRPLRDVVRTAGDQMLDAGHGLSVAHVTLHTSIKSVPSQLTTGGVFEKTRLMDDFLQRIGCDRKAIAVCALNPHGGEEGLFGDEERCLIEPAVSRAIDAGISVQGPFPVDTLIRRAVAGEFDGVVAMYHDQGHIPIKLIGFDSAVNITLGLPIIRTSPTHGTAFDRAWSSATPADESGMLEAVLAAIQLSKSTVVGKK